MNLRFAAIIIAGGLMAESLCWGQGEAQALMVLQKARKTANESNARQGLPPQYPSATPAAPAAPTVPQLTPEQMASVKLSTNLTGIKAPVTPAQKDEMAAALRANARGAAKPSAASINKLAADLSAALADKTVAPAQRGRMTQDLIAVLNNTTLPQSQMNDVIADIPAILKKAGAGEKETTAVGDSIKAVSAEVRKK